MSSDGEDRYNNLMYGGEDEDSYHSHSSSQSEDENGERIRELLNYQVIKTPQQQSMQTPNKNERVTAQSDSVLSKAHNSINRKRNRDDLSDDNDETDSRCRTLTNHRTIQKQIDRNTIYLSNSSSDFESADDNQSSPFNTKPSEIAAELFDHEPHIISLSALEAIDDTVTINHEDYTHLDDVQHTGEREHVRKSHSTAPGRMQHRPDQHSDNESTRQTSSRPSDRQNSRQQYTEVDIPCQKCLSFHSSERQCSAPYFCQICAKIGDHTTFKCRFDQEYRFPSCAQCGSLSHKKNNCTRRNITSSAEEELVCRQCPRATHTAVTCPRIYRAYVIKQISSQKDTGHSTHNGSKKIPKPFCINCGQGGHYAQNHNSESIWSDDPLRFRVATLYNIEEFDAPKREINAIPALETVNPSSVGAFNKYDRNTGELVRPPPRPRSPIQDRRRVYPTRSLATGSISRSRSRSRSPSPPPWKRQRTSVPNDYGQFNRSEMVRGFGGSKNDTRANTTAAEERAFRPKQSLPQKPQLQFNLRNKNSSQASRQSHFVGAAAKNSATPTANNSFVGHHQRSHNTSLYTGNRSKFQGNGIFAGNGKR